MLIVVICVAFVALICGISIARLRNNSQRNTDKHQPCPKVIIELSGYNLHGFARLFGPTLRKHYRKYIFLIKDRKKMANIRKKSVVKDHLNHNRPYILMEPRSLSLHVLCVAPTYSFYVILCKRNIIICTLCHRPLHILL